MVNSLKGFLFVCKLDGTIIRIVRNDFEVQANELEGKLFTSIFHSNSFNNAIQFYHDIKKDSASFGISLTLNLNKENINLNFGGGIFNNEIIIVGSNAVNNFEIFLTELMKINNEQTNLLRSTIKNQKKNFDNNKLDSGYYFDELTRLNNELTSMQRELAKKNSELIALNDLKVVIDYSKCKNISDTNTTSPEVWGGFSINAFEYFSKNSIENPLAYIVFSKTIPINHPIRGFILNYAKLKIYEDNSVIIIINYISTDYKEILMTQKYEGKLNSTVNDEGVYIYN